MCPNRMSQVHTESFDAARKRYTEAAAGTDDWVAAWETFQRALTRQWETSGKAADLDALKGHCLELTELAPTEKKGTSWMVKWLNLTVTKIENLESASYSDLESALLFSRLSLEHAASQQPALCALIKARMAELLLRLYQIGHETAKLMLAVDEAEDAARVDVEDHADRCRIMRILGTTLREKYSCFGGHDDLKASVRATRLSLEALPREEASGRSPMCLALYQNLANALHLLFDVSGDPRHLDEAIEFGHKSLGGGPNGDDAAQCISLVSSLTTRGRLKNDINDIKNAVSIMDKLIVLVSPKTSSRERASMYDHWARALQARYGITNQLQDLEAAILAGKKAVTLFENFPYGAYKASVALEMLILYTKKYERLRKLDDALEGLRYGEMSIQFQVPGSFKLGKHFGQISILYENMFFCTNKREHLTQSLSKAQKSLEFMPNSAIAQNNMACRFIVLYKRDGVQKDLDLALHHIELAFTASEDIQLGRGGLLSTAAEAYRLKYEASEKSAADGSEAEACLVKAVDYFTQSAKHPSNLVLKRIEAARRAAELLGRQCRWEEAYELLHSAVDWIPTLVPIHMSSEDQRTIVKSFFGLAAEACSVAIACGRVREAVEDLERGRGILVAAAHKALHNIDNLQERSPDLFRRYCRARDQLLGVPNGVEGGAEELRMYPDDHAVKRVSQLPSRVDTLNREMEEILKEIRSISGLHRFLEPILSGEMQELCGTKCVVALNTSKFGTHAIILNKERIWSVPLPDPPYIPNFAGALHVGVRVMERIVHHKSDDDWSDWVPNNNSLLGLLAILWHHIAEPVTRELGFGQVRGFESELMMGRRILWLPTGQYSRFPIHAAGLHGGNGKDTLFFGRGVLSTYIASFRQLAFAHSISTDLPSRLGGKGLIISMEPPEGGSDKALYLSNAGVEVEEVTAEASTMIDWEVLRRPTHSEALSSASTCSWLHVASHGVSDNSDPAASFLRLGTDEDDAVCAVQGSRLTVQQIADVRAHQGILAFLSACSTAENKVALLLDESLSIGYAFQLAGFPHIVGCLWPAYEFICPDFAAFFYRYLVQYGPKQGRPLTSDLIAFCVHYAAMSIMISHDCLKEPIFWAGFMHIGA
ncbi:hypothetical protein LMH87_001404 [Akanthomyces muscarius]|uniref:CHAT domain-containing protein n=1 Tax=Akanthomyces muscarius TaxID=2231603 RepID=A0A9W8UHI4_AKAMU|nr:hypothetical protein LMH87_001404 [Akanthomyces muscarius]KAJ4146845.1 hypothetical protein LMH87_001404 [Akanthomyces muscarius]